MRPLTDFNACAGVLDAPQRAQSPFPIYRDPAGELLSGSANTAHILALAAGYAYADPATMSKMMTRVGFAGHETICVSETVDAMYINSTAYLVRSRCGRVVILSYRGTPPASLVTWLGDADVGSDSMRVDGQVVPVHSGFSRNFRATRLEVMAHLHEALDEGMEALFVTGHSLGGALAALFALSLCAPEHRDVADRLRAVYTFGQPMTVGLPLPDVAREMSGKIFRYVLPRDIVPMLPPTGWGSFAHIGREYRHEAGEWRLQAKPVTRALNARELPKAMMSALGPNARRDSAPYTVAVHGPHHYLAALRPAGLVTEFGD